MEGAVNGFNLPIMFKVTLMIVSRLPSSLLYYYLYTTWDHKYSNSSQFRSKRETESVYDEKHGYLYP